MSRESTAAAAPPPRPQTSSHQPQQESSAQATRNNFGDEDDSDFVLVVNRKKNHQQSQSVDLYRNKHRQSYDQHTTDDEHHNQNSYQGRRRKYRDRGGGDQKEKPFRRRDKSHKHDKENINNKTANSTASHHQNQQTLPTSPPAPQPLQQPQQQQITTPSVRSFSLVVACGSKSPPPPPPPLQNQKSTQTEAPQQISLSDQSNDQDSPVRLTNRQILMVMKPSKQQPESLSGGGPSTSSSIPDTSSLTSEETLDSIERKTSADVESNESSSVNNVSMVEYVDAPAPKINPWVANRNAAQVITGVPSTVALTGFPSVGETFTANAPAPPAQKQPLTEQTPPSQKPQQQHQGQQKPRKETSKPETVAKQQSPSFSNAVAPLIQKPNVPVPLPCVNELPKKLLETQVSSVSQEEPQPSVYIREMSNGFRPGRGRGSYSASASAGRKIPSRSSALMKVVSSDRTVASDDWPTLGETVLVTRAQKIGSGDEESVGEAQKPEDVVDHSHANQSAENKLIQPPRKSPPPPAPPQREDSVQKQKSTSPPPQPQQTETTSSSDNDEDINSSNKQRKNSKQKWVPLPLDMTSSQGGVSGENNPPPPEHKKSGKGKHIKYQQSYYHGGYQRAKGKENVAMNGGNDYSDYNAHSHGHNQGRYSNPRGGPHNGHHRSTSQINSSSRGGSNNSNRSRRHHPNHHRSNSTLSLNNHSMMNGSHAPSHHHHHAAYELITSPTNPPSDYPDFSPDFSTLTPMYPAVSEFIMPYVTNGYFPTPLPAGVIVEPDVVSGVPIVVATNAVQSQQPNAAVVATQASFLNGDLTGLTDLVRTQIEYYFSEDNLAKDFFLRRKMDEQGFLPVHLIATFPRVKQMTQDYATVLTAIQSSETLELQQDMSSVRTRVHPEKWPILDPPPSAPINKKCINNNNTPGGGVETLNPNVPEFVPKSKITC